MGYIEQTIGDNETLVYKAHFHWLYYAAAWASAILIAALAIWSMLYTLPPAEWLWLGLSAVLLAILVRFMMPIWTTEIGVTNHRLVLKRGWISRETDELQLKSVEQVNFSQGLLGRIFGFGKVDVHGTGMEELLIPSIANPMELVKAIQNAAGTVKEQMPPISDVPVTEGATRQAS
jgi:uncharacterized membrane protein YdbT with pleckstrin-like domain